MVKGSGRGQNLVPRMKLTVPEYQQTSANLPNSDSNEPVTAKKETLEKLKETHMTPLKLNTAGESREPEQKRG